MLPHTCGLFLYQEYREYLMNWILSEYSVFPIATMWSPLNAILYFWWASKLVSFVLFCLLTLAKSLHFQFPTVNCACPLLKSTEQRCINVCVEGGSVEDGVQ